MRTITAGDVPPRGTGTHSNCAVSGTAGTSPVSDESPCTGQDSNGAGNGVGAGTLATPDTTFPVRTASAATCQSPAATTCPTRSTRNRVTLVVGRICPRTSKLCPSDPLAGTSSRRSENERSESTPQDPSRRCR